MKKTDVLVATAMIAQAVASHDIPAIFATLATYSLLRRGLPAATRAGSSKMRDLRSLFVTFASVAWLIAATVALQLSARIQASPIRPFILLEHGWPEKRIDTLSQIRRCLT